MKYHNAPIRGLLGFCVADALGVPVEFKNRKDLSSDPVLGMRGNGTHKQEPGTWSDDSSQMFCVVESLYYGYDLQKIADTLHSWYYDNHWTARGYVFDIGATTYAAMEMLHIGIPANKSGLSELMDNGNGSLMRTLPLAYFLKDEWDFKYRQKIVHEVSAITHAHPISQIACVIYTEFAIQLLNGVTPDIAYSYCQQVTKALYHEKEYKEHLSVFSRILDNNIATFSENEIRSTGYVVDTLEACLWCVLKGSTYSDTVLRAVNLGHDTDTIGALTGGIAGILYGYNQIPLDWVDSIARINEIITLAKRFDKRVYQCSRVQ